MTDDAAFGRKKPTRHLPNRVGGGRCVSHRKYSWQAGAGIDELVVRLRDL
jgi:hypothetical protein